MHGWSFAGAAAAFFLFPLLLAFLGAALGGGDQLHQLIGATVGLGGGMALATVAKGRRRANEEAAWLRR